MMMMVIKFLQETDIEVNNDTNACEYPPMLDDYIFPSFIALMI